MKLYKAVTKEQCAAILSNEMVDGWYKTKAEAWAALDGDSKPETTDEPKRRGRPRKAE
jgi:hypothetical protein